MEGPRGTPEAILRQVPPAKGSKGSQATNKWQDSYATDKHGIARTWLVEKGWDAVSERFEAGCSICPTRRGKTCPTYGRTFVCSSKAISDHEISIEHTASVGRVKNTQRRLCCNGRRAEAHPGPAAAAAVTGGSLHQPRDHGPLQADPPELQEGAASHRRHQGQGPAGVSGRQGARQVLDQQIHQKEMLLTINAVLEEDMGAALRAAGVLAISMDEATAVDCMAFLSTHIHYVDEETWRRVPVFIELTHIVGSPNAANLMELVKKLTQQTAGLEAKHLARIVSDGADGAAVMTSEHSGLAQRIQQEIAPYSLGGVSLRCPPNAAVRRGREEQRAGGKRDGLPDRVLRPLLQELTAEGRSLRARRSLWPHLPPAAEDRRDEVAQQPPADGALRLVLGAGWKGTCKCGVSLSGLERLRMTNSGSAAQQVTGSHLHSVQ